MYLNKISSNTLNYLKCILCIGVVFIHAHFFPGLSILGGGNFDEYKVYIAIDSFFNAAFLNCTCVPLFFVISGYLFFLNLPDTFKIKSFEIKWVKRLKSLLLPYLISNFIYLILNILIGNKIDFWCFITAFWTYDGYFPALIPTWYIRDLMIMCLLSPIFWLALKYSRFLLPLILCFCWFMCWWKEIPGIGIRSILFYTIGAYIGMFKYDLIAIFNPHKFSLLWGILFATLYGIYIYCGIEWIHKLSILASFPVWICFAYMVVSILKKECSSNFVAGTFFVFLYHYSIAHRMSVYFTKIFGVSEPAVILSYFCGAVFTVSLLLCFYYVGRKYIPQIIMIAVGGR